MKINFLVNTTGLTGGIKVVFELANQLEAKGHQVKIYYPYLLSDRNWFSRDGLMAMLKMLKFTFVRRIAWFDLWVPVLRVPRLTEKYLTDADAVVATAHETAAWCAALPERCGQKFYFIQGYENWAESEEALHATYRPPMTKIVISTDLGRKIESICGEKPEVVINGINPQVFYPLLNAKNEFPTILMLYHTNPQKGVQLGLQVVSKVKAIFPDLKLVLFGAYKPQSGELPDYAEFEFKPSPSKLRELYNKADVYLCPSLNEGGPLTNMEAMACGTAVLTTRVGAVPDYAVEGESALVVEPGSSEQMTQSLIKLLENENLRSEVAKMGLKQIQKFTTTAQTDNFERILLKYSHK